MNLEDVNKLLDAGFSAAFIERILTPEAPETTTAPAAPETTTPTNPDLAALNQKIAELLGAVQQHNILTISRETPPQSPGEIAEAYLTNLINGGEKNNG